MDFNPFAVQIVESEFGTARTNVLHATSNAHNICMSPAGWYDLVVCRIFAPVFSDVMRK